MGQWSRMVTASRTILTATISSSASRASSLVQTQTAGGSPLSCRSVSRWTRRHDNLVTVIRIFSGDEESVHKVRWAVNQTAISTVGNISDREKTISLVRKAMGYHQQLLCRLTCWGRDDSCACHCKLPPPWIINPGRHKSNNCCKLVIDEARVLVQVRHARHTGTSTKVMISSEERSVRSSHLVSPDQRYSQWLDHHNLRTTKNAINMYTSIHRQAPPYSIES